MWKTFSCGQKLQRQNVAAASILSKKIYTKDVHILLPDYRSSFFFPFLQIVLLKYDVKLDLRKICDI